jgi:hypothetical protein
MFSRNSASSRAIPVAKQVKAIKDAPALPLEYRYNQAGMQAAAELSFVDRHEAEKLILEYRDAGAELAERLATIGPVNPDTGKPLGLHKQWANRYIEPFQYHTVIVSSTEWENFFAQRCSPLAQPEIRVAAELIRREYRSSKPATIFSGGWHLPYIHDEDRVWAREQAGTQATDLLIQVAVARCARVSYLTQNGVRDQNEDLILFDRLVNADPAHYSPLEHVATPNPENKTVVEIPARLILGQSRPAKTLVVPRVGNFLGWDQVRHLV